MNIKLVHEFVEDCTITMSTSEDANNPMANLKDRNPNHTWKGGSAVKDQTIVFDCGAARTVDTVVVGNMNFLSCHGDTGINWQSSTNGVSWTTRGTFASAVNGTEELEISSVSARYWRVQFSGTVDLPAIPQIGNIAFGTRVELFPYNNGAKISDAHNTQMRTSLDGTKFTSQPYKGFKRWNVKWTLLSDTERTNMLNVNKSVRGKFLSFYFVDMDGAVYLVNFMVDEISMELFRYNLNNTADIPIESFSVNT